ncbi:MAG: copper amine oxidase N-terminal domain-containing protein [Clostridia bacterium]|jgi:hypothetical protein|nr:copper amine oxidase N-terminal domain-containing protein [Clostridia bacterium]
MKKFIAATAIFTMLISSSAYAYTDNHITKDMPTALDKTVKSELVIEASDDFASCDGNASFYLDLSNAEWDCDTSGEFETGIDYNCVSDTEMIVTVDTKEFDATKNDIEIPITAKVQETGVASVTINPSDSPVSSGTYIFAHSGYPAMDIVISPSTKAEAFDMTIEDDYPYSTVNGRIFKLQLENGFVFTGECDASGTGKFKNKVEFSKYSDSIAYISLSSDSDASTGTIVLKNIGIEHTDKSTVGDIYMSISAINTSGYSGRVKIGTYKPSETKTDDNNNTGNTSNADKEYVKFKIGSGKYYVSSDGAYYLIDSENSGVLPFIDENDRTMVPLRAVANALGINDIKWDDSSKTVTFTNSEDTVKIKIGENKITVNSTEVSIDTAAVIKDNRTFIPLRAVANAFGIQDENIVWDEGTKTIKIYK